MKTPLIICGLAIVIFAACKKDRTCSCTLTKTGTSTTTASISLSVTIPGVPIPLPPIAYDTTEVTAVGETQSIDRKMKEVSKKQGDYNCVSYSEPYTETTHNVVTNFTLTTTETGTKDYSCKLK
jgi:hypothetical protein